jgi:superfamily II DNA or RNA helicase
MPLHSKAKEFHRKGLYSGLSSFAELERRIDRIKEPLERGHAFEVFAEGYFATQRRDIAKVLPQNTASLAVLKKLGLPFKDMGADGVIESNVGGYGAYQVKYRSGRPNLLWDDLSTFFGISDSHHIGSRIVFTNSLGFPHELSQRHGFFCIRGSDLDRLGTKDFEVIDAWLKGEVIEFTKNTPRNHQQDALAALVPALREDRRVTAIMACGTGKTLVTMWAAEELKSQRILVLLPSLALLRQTLHEWLAQTNLPSLAYLCVCSDQTVSDGIDEIVTPQSDLDFEVSTDSKIVRKFLDAPFKGPKVIFCTYQSASVVGGAIKKKESFDLGIFDEAHKTAGREGRNWGYALEDKNIPIQRRLFVTATPRHYNPAQKDREGEAKLVFSMDNPEVYGRQVYTLSFSEAARLGIICVYKVIISVITSRQVDNDVLSRGEVQIKGDSVRARQVANQIVLRDVVKKHDVRKIFTFHSTVKSASSFVAEGNEGVRTHIPDFESLHVSGGMPTSQRERQMNEFRKASRAVMSNARCLTEGVDVPAVDLVAFLSPRKSRVDIVQAIGRAMRKSPGKDVGYVLLPLYVEQGAGESVESAIARSGFDEIVEVLQSLIEQDTIFKDLIRTHAIQKGQGIGFDDSRLHDRIEFIGPAISVNRIKEALESQILEKLHTRWDVMLGKLKALRKVHGHCNLKVKDGVDSQVAGWIITQRSFRNRGELSEERIKMLDAIGFSWDPHEESWERMFDNLLLYKKENGHCDVSQNDKNSTLYTWVKTQRRFFKSGTLNAERVKRLDEVEFRWNISTEKSWEERYADLLKFKSVHGHTRIPVDYKDDPVLGRWLAGQRVLQRSGKLDSSRQDLLNKCGMVWSKYEETWDQMFKSLEKYKNLHGNCEVPSIYPKNPALGKWVHRQRAFKKNGKIRREHATALEQLGFRWESVDIWNLCYQDLVRFKTENGHCLVNTRSSLGKWVLKIRRLRKEGKLPPDREMLLNTMGFVWESFKDSWESKYEELIHFKNTHGNCNVPSTYTELGRWVATQRTKLKQGTLSEERILLLNQINFLWEGFSGEKSWEERYADLLNFQRVHGHCDVPSTFPSDPSLAMWVGVQRRSKKKNSLNSHRKTLLDQIGFTWDPLGASWQKFFVCLQRFKDTYGHCNVPGQYNKDRELANWVANQRQRNRIGKVPLDRFNLLNDLGFNWKA